ncbi:MAG: hypothetical protein AAF541_12560 [Pseudomonadota bacterium]
MIKELVERKVLRVVSGYAVVCFVVLQIADVTFEPLGITSDTLKSIIAIMVLGFPVVTYLAWIFDVSDEQALVKQRSSALEAAFFVLALALFGGGVWFSLYSDTPFVPIRSVDTAEEKSTNTEHPKVVVVPFTNMSADTEQDYFVAGLSEELISALSTSNELAVVARASSFALRDRPMTIREIGELVNASHVVEGSVRKRDEFIRVTVTLSEVSSGTQLWANSYDRTLGDIFAMQENIASSVATTLRVRLNRANTILVDTDSQAYPLYVQGRGILSLSVNTPEQLKIAQSSLDDALALDAEYVPAILEKSRLLLRQEQLQIVPPGSLEQERTALLRRALEISPNHPTANSYMGWNWIYTRNNPYRGLDYYRKALEAAPYEPEILRGFANVLLHLGHPELGKKVAKFVVERDPLCGICFRTLANAHLQLDQYQESAEVLRLTNEFSPNPQLQYLRALVLTKAKDHEGARQIAATLGGIPQAHIMGNISIQEGLPGALDSAIKRFRSLHPGWHPAIAEFYLLAGHNDEAVAYLLSMDPSSPEFSPPSNVIPVSLYFKELESDARVEDIRRSLGDIPPERVEIDFEILAING